MRNPEQAIGVFDSGLGGLTVLRAIHETLPAESTVYLGDTARVPYGIRSRETVRRYARECAAFLVARGIKLLVVACNTASALALDALREDLGIPVIGVIEPGARAAVRLAPRKRISVLGTRATIESGAYQEAIRRLSAEAEVEARACPLFVPLAEEGWVDDEVARLVARRYLEGLEGSGAVVLGCTHYPLLARVIGETLPGVPLVDSARETADEVRHILSAGEALNPGARPAGRTYFVTDTPQRFSGIIRRFLGHAVPEVTKIDLERGGTA